MFSETTDAITVTVKPVFLKEHSAPDQARFVWAYMIKIENAGTETVQLINRHWEITDGMGRKEEVHGPGVVGEQPVLNPGESYEYTSNCPLSTPSGFMVGSYDMVGRDGRRFAVRIPLVSLDTPDAVTQIH